MARPSLWDLVPSPVEDQSQHDAMWDYVEGLAAQLYPGKANVVQMTETYATLAGTALFNQEDDPEKGVWIQKVLERLQPDQFEDWLIGRMVMGVIRQEAAWKVAS